MNAAYFWTCSSDFLSTSFSRRTTASEESISFLAFMTSVLKFFSSTGPRHHGQFGVAILLSASLIAFLFLAIVASASFKADRCGATSWTAFTLASLAASNLSFALPSASVTACRFFSFSSKKPLSSSISANAAWYFANADPVSDDWRAACFSLICPTRDFSSFVPFRRQAASWSWLLFRRPFADASISVASSYSFVRALMRAWRSFFRFLAVSQYSLYFSRPSMFSTRFRLSALLHSRKHSRLSSLKKIRAARASWFRPSTSSMYFWVAGIPPLVTSVSSVHMPSGLCHSFSESGFLVRTIR